MSIPIFSAVGAARLDEKKSRNGGSPDPKRRGNSMGAILGAFPLFIIPVGIYTMIALTTAGDPVLIEWGGQVLTENGSPLMAVLGQKFFSVPMLAGETEWVLTRGDSLLLLSIIILFAEILKATSTRAASIANHAFSMLVFIVCLMAFLLHPNFATSVFFIITIMALLDVLAGVVVTIISARRDFAVGEGLGG